MNDPNDQPSANCLLEMEEGKQSANQQNEERGCKKVAPSRKQADTQQVEERGCVKGATSRLLIPQVVILAIGVPVLLCLGLIVGLCATRCPGR